MTTIGDNQPVTTNPAGSPKVELDRTDEFRRFEQLTRDLLRVPKKEIQKERDKTDA